MSTNLLTVIVPIDWSQLSHIILLAQKWAGPTWPNSHLSTVLLPVNCVTTLIHLDGSQPLQHAYKLSSPLQLVLHTEITKHHIQQARTFIECFFFQCLKISSKCY